MGDDVDLQLATILAALPNADRPANFTNTRNDSPCV